MEGYYKFLSGGGTFIHVANPFKGKYEAKEEFLEEWGGGFQPKQPSGKEVGIWIFP